MKYKYKYNLGDKVKINNKIYVNIEDTGTITGFVGDMYIVDCVYNNNASCPNAHHALAFNEEEIENYD